MHSLAAVPANSFVSARELLTVAYTYQRSVS